MPAYILVDIEVTNPDQYAEYRPLAAEAIRQHGGTYVVRGGACETLEGGWTPERLVILEFPTMEQAKAWYNSTEYSQARGTRSGAARVRMVVVQGV